MADTSANEAHYVRPGTNTDLRSAYAQARAVGLVQYGTHAAHAAEVAGCTTSEQAIFGALHRHVSSGKLLIADRGFFSYTNWKESAATGLPGRTRR